MPASKDDIALFSEPAPKAGASAEDVAMFAAPEPPPRDPRFVEPPEGAAARTFPRFNDELAALGAEKSRVAALPDDPGFLARAGQSIKQGAHAVKTVGSDVVQHPLDTLADPSKRRQLERGLDDMITLGYGQKLAARVGNALGDTPDRALGGETFGRGEVANTKAADQAANPEYRTVGQLAGAFAPGAASVAGKAAASGVKALAPVAKTAIGKALTGVGSGVASYEATAPALAALHAESEGDRAGAAERAAGDPLGLLASGAAGLATSGAGQQAVRDVKKAETGYKAQAIKNAEGWVAKDINGDIKSASTPTARKQAADDAETVSRLVLRDRALDKAVTRAESGGLDHLQDAQRIVQERLATIGKKLSPNWKRIGENVELTSGDVVNHLEQRAGGLEATGHTTDAAEAVELRRIAKNLRNAKDWGGGKETVKLSPEAQADVEMLEKVRPNIKNAQAAKQIDDQITALRETGAKEKTFDPTHKITPEQLQRLWSDEAGIAYGSQGGINGTATFERKLDVASHLRDLRDDMLARAAQSDPAAVEGMRTDLRDYSGLKRIEKIFDQRINHAKANAHGAGIPAGFMKHVKEFKHAPLGKTLSLIPEGAIGAKKLIDKSIARRSFDTVAAEEARQAALADIVSGPRTDIGRRVMAAINVGVPREQAMDAARKRAAQ